MFFKQPFHLIFVVGRVHKNKIKSAGCDRQGKRPAANVQPDDTGLSIQSAMGNILLYYAAGSGGFVHKYGMGCAPAQCLKAKGTGACKQVQNQRIFNPGFQNIEDRFFDPVGRGPDLPSFGRKQFSASAGAADDAQKKPLISSAAF